MTRPLLLELLLWLQGIEALGNGIKLRTFRSRFQGGGLVRLTVH